RELQPDRRLARPQSRQSVLPARNYVAETRPRRWIPLIDRGIVPRTEQEKQRARKSDDGRQRGTSGRPRHSRARVATTNQCGENEEERTDNAPSGGQPVHGESDRCSTGKCRRGSPVSGAVRATSREVNRRGGGDQRA